VRNVGALAAPGPMTVNDTLPGGLTYISGTGNGWSCAATGQAVECTNREALDAGGSTSLALTVAVSASAYAELSNSVSVNAAGDLITSNNSASDITAVTSLSAPNFEFTPANPSAGKQATAGIRLPSPFPYDVTGTVTLTFAPDAAIGIDDPSIQFESGGREVGFVIPANTSIAQFGAFKLTQIGFQTGTVAGTLSFAGVAQAGTAQKSFTFTVTVPRRPPTIYSMQKDPKDSAAILITLFSTSREVTQLVLHFNTSPAVRLNCGSVTGCSVSGTTLTFDVRSLFDAWYASDTVHGSLSTLRLPFSVQGSFKGSASVSLQNNEGVSATSVFTFP
jgi:hypothetical protein